MRQYKNLLSRKKQTENAVPQISNGEVMCQTRCPPQIFTIKEGNFNLEKGLPSDNFKISFNIKTCYQENILDDLFNVMFSRAKTIDLK